MSLCAAISRRRNARADQAPRTAPACAAPQRQYRFVRGAGRRKGLWALSASAWPNCCAGRAALSKAVSRCCGLCVGAVGQTPAPPRSQGGRQSPATPPRAPLCCSSRPLAGLRAVCGSLLGSPQCCGPLPSAPEPQPHWRLPAPAPARPPAPGQHSRACGGEIPARQASSVLGFLPEPFVLWAEAEL